MQTARLLIDSTSGPPDVVRVHFDNGTDAPPLSELTARVGLDRTGAISIDGRAVSTTEPMSAAGLVDGSHLGPAAEDRIDEIPADDHHRAPRCLVTVAGPGTGCEWPLRPGLTTVGTGRAVDLWMDGPSPTPPWALALDPDGTCRYLDRNGAISLEGDEVFEAAGRLFVVATPAAARPRVEAGTTIPVRPSTVDRPSLAEAPLAPAPTTPGRFPPTLSWVAVLAPLVMGAVIALLWSPRFALFAAFGPVLAVGTWLEQRRRHRRDMSADEREHERSLEQHNAAMARHDRMAASQRRERFPCIADITSLAAHGGPRLWSGSGPLEAIVGWSGRRPEPLRLAGRTVVLIGPDDVARGLVRHMVLQLAVTHPPSMLFVHPWRDPDTSPPDWARWLPHDEGSHVGRQTVHVFDRTRPMAPPDGRASHIVLASTASESPPWSDVVVTIDDHCHACITDRSRQCTPDGGQPLLVAPVDAGKAHGLARQLARWREIGHETGRSTSEPLHLVDVAASGGSASEVLDRWSTASSETLTAPIGATHDEPMLIDLIEDGPHAVIGGTTGSGKSELLRTVVASLCARYPPEQVNFVLVDYKGGSAFDGCAHFPQVITVVTDLDGGRTDRVLAGVDAELTRREHWLRVRRIADLSGAQGDPDRPPRLVLIIDEFAAMVTDHPTQMPSLVDVARRGRSLGLHLVLATQRPGGSMTDDIRANTDLRIALRMVDNADSIDVIGVPDAARLPADRPGLALVRRSGRPVERCRVAMSSTPAPKAETIEVEWLTRPPAEDEAAGHAVSAADVPGHLAELATWTRQATDRSGRRPPRRLWPPDLPDTLDARDLRPPPEMSIVPIGLVDDLALPEHRQCEWRPAQGALALVGGRRAGVPDVLGGAVAALSNDRRSTHVYAVSGTDELDSWHDLPAVGAVVRAHDRDGLRRLLDRLERADMHVRSTHLVLIAHDLSGIARELDDLDGLRLLDRLHRRIIESPRSGWSTIVTAARPAGIPGAVAGIIDRRLIGAVAQNDDYRMLGLQPPSVRLAKGRCIDESGHHVQLATCEQTSLPDLPGLRPSHPPVALTELPTDVGRPQLLDSTADSVGNHEAWALPIGLGFDGPAHLPLLEGLPPVVTGPPGSGRTATLETLAAEAAAAHWLVVWHPATHSGDHHEAWATASQHIHTGRRVDRPVLLLVDDGSEVDDTDGLLRGLMRSSLRPPDHRLVVALDPGGPRPGYGHWTGAITRRRIGVALHHDPETDRDLWLASLPPPPLALRPPGRGLLICGTTEATEIQVARP